MLPSGVIEGASVPISSLLLLLDKPGDSSNNTNICISRLHWKIRVLLTCIPARYSYGDGRLSLCLFAWLLYSVSLPLVHGYVE